MRLNQPIFGPLKPAGPSSEPSRPSDAPPVPVIDAARLFEKTTEIRLLHGGCEYRLRVTRQGKLLLTK